MTRLIYSCANCALLYQMSPKNEPLFVKYFFGDYTLKIIEILFTAIQVYFLHFYVIFKNLVTSYASMAKLKMMFQEI